jgi:hypothetical protein
LPRSSSSDRSAIESRARASKDSIDSAGPKPDVRITNAAGKVRVEGAEESNSVEYEATRYAMGSNPATAKQLASEVPVGISREDSKVDIETDGGRRTGADYALRIPAGGSVEIESGDIVARLPAEDTKDLTLQTRVGSVLRESPDEKQGS